MDDKHGVVTTILRAAGAEKYVKEFKEHHIDLSYLKLLSDEDLRIIGVDDANTRNNILKNCYNLQMRIETKIDMDIDKKYVKIVMNQILNQLQLHHANIACAVLRTDTIVCDIKLQKACLSLLNCLQSLEKEVNLVQKKVNPMKTTLKNRKIISLTLVTIALLGISLKIIAKE